LHERGEYGQAVSVFPSVTPVCLSSIATGANVAEHGIPHIVWFDAEQGRVVDYGSSVGAVVAAGPLRVARDAMIEMTRTHLSSDVATVFERLEATGLVTATVSFTCFRGPVTHKIRFPGAVRRGRWFETIEGPSKFFFFNLYESEQLKTPIALRSRASGSVDAYGAAVASQLVERDEFDYFLYYLPDLDYAAHAGGELRARVALRRVDIHLGTMFEAAGGIDAFLERYAIVVSSDHGFSAVRESSRLEEEFSDLRLLRSRGPGNPNESDVAVCASMRAGAVYRLPGCALDVRELARRAEACPAADVVFFMEGEEAVARRQGEELRFRQFGNEMLRSGAADLLDDDIYPHGLERAWHALSAERSGDVLVSAADGWEFVDLAGRDHVGGASHGALSSADSVVPVLAAGLRAPLPVGLSIADFATLACAHFHLT
jgi:hypothetical protein